MIESENKYFGRKRGKSFQRLSIFQDLLSQPSNTFFKNLKNNSQVFEIGIGDGIKIANDAQKNPKTIFIGCDIFIDGILRAARFKLENKLENLFVFHINVQNLIPLMLNKSLKNIRIFFPDPWPKNRHKKRRTFNLELLTNLLPKMMPHCQIDFATDHGDYFLDAMILVSKNGFNMKNITPEMWQYSVFNAINTKYEKKALDKNSKLFYFSVLKTN